MTQHFEQKYNAISAFAVCHKNTNFTRFILPFKFIVRALSNIYFLTTNITDNLTEVYLCLKCIAEFSELLTLILMVFAFPLSKGEKVWMKFQDT